LGLKVMIVKRILTGKKAFTLIELLVVIAIIALLLSILIPALSKVKDAAAMKLCGNNARQIMMARMAYAADNDDEVPRSATHYRNEGPDMDNDSWVCLPIGDPTRTPVTTADFINPRNGATLEQRLAGIRHGTLFPYLENTEVYNCLKDDRQRKYGQGFRSYSLSQMVFNGTERDDARAKWGPVAKRVAEVRLPASRMAVVEQADPRGQYNWGGFVYAPYGNLGDVG
jgi:prepilin-type N-terminal cleavage/methylation domain-containing protein